ncbi:MAG: phage portal protein [Sphingobacterium sp.]|nr:phage portal protein [Sphingobacterium sp.]
MQRDLSALRDRHRDLARNNPWARRAISAIVNNTIGPGIIAKWPDDDRQARWSRWFESTAIDADGRTHGYGLQSLILRTIVESGECLVRRRTRRPNDGCAIPLQIQILEPDYLDHNKTQTLPNGHVIVQGVEFNAWGRRVAYWLFRSHPGEHLVGRGPSITSAPIPASEILHLYRADRSGQVRGVPWGTGAMTRLWMLDGYQDAQLERQRNSACFMAFRRQTDLSIEPVGMNYELFDKLEPGAIEDLPPGVDLTFATPPQPEDDKEFRLAVLQACAADYNLPYEALTGDLSQVNFSSARMGWNEFGRSIDVWRWQMLAPQLLAPLVRWYLEAELVAGHAVPDLDVQPLWTPPARTLVDPVREIPAIQNAVRAGLLSIQQAIRQQGYDPKIIAHENAEFFHYADALGIRFDSDARPLAPESSDPSSPEDPEDAS